MYNFHINFRMPMLDLLIHVTAANKIPPSSHVLHVTDQEGRSLTHKPSTPIGNWSFRISLCYIFYLRSIFAFFFFSRLFLYNNDLFWWPKRFPQRSYSLHCLEESIGRGSILLHRSSYTPPFRQHSFEQIVFFTSVRAQLPLTGHLHTFNKLAIVFI